MSDSRFSSMNQANSGIIMALDNILALFMLPLFGALSDRCKSKRGRRTPFIVIGTLCAAVLLVGLSFTDNAQLKNISDVSKIDDPAALSVLYNAEKDETLQTTENESFVLGEKFTEEEFTAIRSQVTNPDTGKTSTSDEYLNYVVPARQHYAQQQPKDTFDNPEDAAAETQRALLKFSETINKAIQ